MFPLTSLFREARRRHYGKNEPSYRRAFKDSVDVLQRLELQQKLAFHSGCVNTIAWNERGTLLLSGSDDHTLVISNADNFTKHSVIYTPHTANIFSAKFLPGSGDRKLVSCAGDGHIVYTDVCKQPESSSFHCHTGSVYDVEVIPGDPHSFLSCGEDGTIRWFDTRVETSCAESECTQDVMIDCDKGMSCMALNPNFSYELAVGAADSCVRLYDRRMLCTRQSSSQKNTGLSGLVSKFLAPNLGGRLRRVTSVNFRPDGLELLASYSSDYIYIFDPKESAETKGKRLKVGRPSRRKKSSRARNSSPTPMKKLRLRGDWSDTGPNSRPETETRTGQGGTTTESERSAAQTALLQRMTYALSRMLNDPDTRLAMNSRLDPDETVSRPAQHRRSETDVISDIQDSMNLTPSGSGSARSSSTTAAARSAAAATAIQERWRAYRARRQQQQQDNDQTSQQYYQQQFDQTVDTSQQQDDHDVQNEDNSEQQHHDHDDQTELHQHPQIEVNPHQQQQLTDNNVQQQPSDANLQQQPTDDNLQQQPIDDNLLQQQQQQTEMNPQERQEEIFSSDSSDSEETLNCDTEERTKETKSLTQLVFEANTSRLGSAGEGTAAVGETHDGPRDTAGNDTRPDNENLLEEESGGRTRRSHENLERLQDTYSDLRQSGVETTLQLRYGGEGSTSSSIAVSAEPLLPGPSRVVTGPGRVGIDPVTGQRRRRPGVSSVPTSSILLDEARASQESEEDTDMIEYESEDCSDQEEDESEDREDRQILQPPVRQKLIGHRNVRTMIKEATWWGNKYILSGSDCGHIFGWDRDSGQLVFMQEADRHVVNCLQPHPSFPLLATAGIDHDVKIWAPTAPFPVFHKEVVDIVSRRNEVMLEETRDTITVPASLMIRMLASLNQIRRGGATQSDSDADS